jgi:subtilisin
VAKKSSARPRGVRAGGGVRTGSVTSGEGTSLTSSIDDMLLAAASRGDGSFETGRFLITYKEEAKAEGIKSLRSLGLRAADARDFKDQAVGVQDVGDADALVFPEIGVTLVSGDAVNRSGLAARALAGAESASDPVEAVEPEYFVFAMNDPGEYLRGFLAATEAIKKGLGHGAIPQPDEADVEAEALGATWGLIACRVPPSTRTGAGIKVAVLDTGMDMSHPDFVGRSFTAATFVGQPVQDLHGHGTHCIGTSCGPKSPSGTTPRYGIAHQARIFVGKVLSNSGGGTTASVLAGMNWAIANRCAVISMSLGGQAPVQAAYTAAGQAALNTGCLIIAAAGNAASQTGAPANSPTIMSVASLDQNLAPSSFSNFGKVEIAGPGRDIFSAAPMPRRYQIMSGTSMATPHVAGCAALWAQSSSTLRGAALWSRLRATARPLPHPATRVGRGLVQAP